jgi:hypothetical protein
MSEEFLVSILSVFGSLVVSTVVAYILLNLPHTHSHGKH